MNYCKNCIHVERDGEGRVPFAPRCMASKYIKVDLVMGGMSGGFCETERSGTDSDRCGEQGRLFAAYIPPEPKK